MKKILVISLLMLLISSIGFSAEIRWASTNLGAYGASPDGTTWSLADNWLNLTIFEAGTPPFWTVPAALDLVVVDIEPITGFPNTTMPMLNVNAGQVSILDFGRYTAGASSLSLGNGAYLNPTNFTRLGYIVDSVGTLNLSGNSMMVSNAMYIGFNVAAENAGGSGVINMSDDSILHMGAVGFGQAMADYAVNTAYDGTGHVTLADNARFIVNGDQTTLFTTALNNNWIEPANPSDILDIVYNYDGGGNITSTEINVIPEPATLIILGIGGLLLRRRR